MEVKGIKTVIDDLDDFIEVPNGIYRLRNLVLDLAVSGLLTEQQKEDGSAEGLYEEIQNAKDKTVVGKKKPKQLTQLDTNEIPFSIPVGWKWTKLGQISNYGSPKKISPKNIEEGTLVVELEDIEKDSGKLIQKRYFPDREVKSDRSFFDKDFVLYGKLRPYLNKVIVTDSKGVCSTELVPLEMFAGCNSEYIKLTLMSGYFVNHVNKLTYGVKMPRLGTADGQNAPIPLPPLAEQKRIVERVDELMKLIDQLEVDKKERDEVRGKMAISAFYSFGTEHNEFALKHLTELVKTPSDIDELEKSILSLAVAGKLTQQDPKDRNVEDLYKEIQKAKEKAKTGGKKTKQLVSISDEEIPFEIPKNWKWVRLGDICSRITKGSTPTTYGFAYVEKGINFVKVESISKSGDFIPSKLARVTEECQESFKRSQLLFDDLLFSIAGALGRVGHVNNPNVLPANTNQALAIISPINVENRFFFLTLKSSYIFPQIEKLKVGMAQQNLSLKQISELPVPLPPVTEQKRVVVKVNELMVMVQKLREVMDK